MIRTVLVLTVFVSVASAAPPDPTIMSSSDMDWIQGSYPGVTLKQFPGELGHMNMVRYAAGTVFAIHHHVNEQIMIIQSGNYRIEVDGTDHLLSPGDVIIIPAYALHEVEALDNSSHIEFFAPADLKPGFPE